MTAIPEDKIYHVRDLLNNYLKGVIKFTEEVEENQQINFLDLTIHVDDTGKMKSNWFTKPIASNRLINYYSAHSQHMKFNVAKSFIRKVLAVSHFDFHKENKVKIETILVKNNYPLPVIKKLPVMLGAKVRMLVVTQQQYRRALSRTKVKAILSYLMRARPIHLSPRKRKITLQLHIFQD